ncbi:MAG: helix-turn-helix transcriptional regulator, partial [Candidatus Heimdallarchaeaceae archaeon]
MQNSISRNKKLIISIIASLMLFSNTIPTRSFSNLNMGPNLSPSDSFAVRYHSVKIDIETPDTISTVESFLVENLENESLASIPIWLNHSLISIEVYDSTGYLLYDWIPVSNSTHLIIIYFRSNISSNEMVSFSISYEFAFTLPLIEDEINYYTFEYYVSLSYDTSVLSVSFKLPENSFIHQGDISSVYPEDAEQTVAYNRIIISWQLSNLSAYSNPLFFTRFDEPISQEENTFFQKTLNIFISGLLIGTFLGISIMSWLARHKEKKARKQMGLSLLDDNQKELIRIIYEHNGKISQREMCDVTGFSKSKISRNLIPLEKRGLIYREKWGRTYVVYLTKEGRS